MCSTIRTNAQIEGSSIGNFSNIGVRADIDNARYGLYAEVADDTSNVCPKEQPAAEQLEPTPEATELLPPKPQEKFLTRIRDRWFTLPPFAK